MRTVLEWPQEVHDTTKEVHVTGYLLEELSLREEQITSVAVRDVQKAVYPVRPLAQF